MRSMEFSGRNIDEAIFHGLNEMGLTIDEVDTEIVQRESKGLFGIGAKNAIVRLTEREVPVVPDFEAEKTAAHERKSERKRNDGERRERTEKKPRSDRREQGGGRREKQPEVPAIAYSAELAKEKERLNRYHAKVWEEISPLLSGEEKEWLREATRKI